MPSTATHETPKLAKRRSEVLFPRGRSLLPGWRSLTIAAFFVLAIVLIRTFDSRIQAAFPIIDPAIINFITLALGFFACCTLIGWFFLYGDYSSRTQLIVGVGLIVSLVAAFVAIRLDGFDGDMVPRFAWRWSPATDTYLKPVAPTAERSPGAVDLSEPTPSDFPQFLGPDRSAHLAGPKLETDWEANPPKLLWRQPIGAGWCAFSVVHDYAYTMEQRGPDEWVTCYHVETGEPIWGHSLPVRHETKLGGIGPRSTPTVHDGRVYALGATGVLQCFDAATGNVLWSDDVLARLGLTAEEDDDNVAWGRAASPLIVDDMVVIPAGGKPGKTKSLIAYNRLTGDVVWTGGDKQIAYASPALATIGGKRQILTVNEDTVAGHDAETGEELWTFPWPGSSSQNASNSQAVPLSEDRVFISKGYGAGSAVFKIKSSGGKWTAEEVWANRRALKTKFANVAVINGYAYGLGDAILECVDVATGESQWRKGRYGNGQLLGVGDRLLVISEKGELVQLEATPEAHEVLGSIQALDGRTWNNLCLSGDRLLVRNAEEAACYRLPVASDK
jgi:outer membrane protein assembly factor BamB